MKWRILVAAWLTVVSLAAWGTPLGWNLNLGAVGGSNATAIDHVIIDGVGAFDQQVAGGIAAGLPFTYHGTLGLTSFQQVGTTGTSSFGLPASYTDLYFRFQGLTGLLTPSGDATFDPGSGSIALYLDQGRGSVPGASALSLATFMLAPATGTDVDFFDGGGINAILNLNLQPLSSLSNLLTDANGAPFGPQSTLSFNLYTLLDPALFPNPTGVPSGTGTSTSQVIPTGELRASNGPAVPLPTIPEPASLALLALGLPLLAAMRRRSAR